jgi:hypothetical protein
VRHQEFVAKLVEPGTCKSDGEPAPKRSGWTCSASTISPPYGGSLLIGPTRPPVSSRRYG